ncbi:MAG: hypothetical protein ACI4VW_09170 [Acutalibacteraceae bacterium]
MIAYYIMMFSAAALLISLGIAIYNGKTEYIHFYHQEKVTDKKGYGKSFGKALWVTAVAPFLSGVIGLFGDSDPIAITAVIVLLIGLCIGFVCIFSVQRKYNKGIF